MSERSVSRALLRFGALTTAAVLAFGGATTGALAQEPETPTSSAEPAPTSEPSSPPSTPQSPTSEAPAPTSETSTPPSSTEPAPTPSSEAPAPEVKAPAETPAETPRQEEQKHEQTAQGSPDLKLTVKFGKAEYNYGEALDLTVTLRNAGDAAANQIRFASEPWGMSLNSGLDQLVSRPSLAPGESKTIKLGAAQQPGNPRVGLTLRAYAEGATDPTPNDNLSRGEAAIVQNTGRVNGLLWEDKDSDGIADPGEGVAWRSLKLFGGTDLPTFTTGPDGRFSMFSIPAGTYQARIANGSGYEALKPGQFIVVKKDELTEVSLQVVPALSRTLQVVGHSFDKPEYGKNDPISVTVQLRNTGTKAIDNLVAICDPENDGATLDGTGPGWGDLVPGKGISIPANTTKPVTITDVVPDAAYLAGKVYFACAFSVDGRNSDGPIHGPGGADPGLTVGAKVVGAHGNVSGWLSRPGNDSVKLVAINPKNGRVLGTTLTGGSYSFQDLPQGQVVLKVVGNWRYTDGSTERLVDVVGGQNVTVNLDVESGPAVADPSVDAPDLKLSVTFDQTEYDFGEPVQLTIKVENVGTGTRPAEGRFQETYLDEQPSMDYNQLSKFLYAGVSLWPGESTQITVPGTIRDRGPSNPTDKVRYKLDLYGPFNETNKDNNKADASAKVTFATGSAAVTVYGDRNLNGQLDAGEELANRNVRVGGGKPHVNKNGRSDASGKLRFTDLPAGLFWAYDEYDRESGWVSPEGGGTEFVVNPGDEGTAQVRLVRPLSDELKVSMAFDRPSYEPGAQLGLTVSITNDTAKPLQVKANCGGAWGPYLGNEDAAWGELAQGGPGVLVAPGVTEVRHVQAAVPAAAADHGYVSVACGIGPDNGLGNPWVRAEAKVPGATNTFRGTVVTGQWPDLKPIPNVPLLLLDPDTGKTVARTVTDAEGAWIFPNLPVGVYTPLVVGPWKVIPYPSDGAPFANVRGEDYPYPIFVEPGPDVADPDATAPGGNPGAGAGGGGKGVLPVKNSDALANTGVSVLGLVLFGSLLVMAGAALRRRPATS